MRIHADADRADLDCAAKDEMELVAPVVQGVDFALFEGDKIRALSFVDGKPHA